MTAGVLDDSETLRFTTAGSVDDGKSTLIGRLLYDSKAVFDDQYEAVRKTSERRGDEQVNLALLTDGLRAEREQGITIDVAYRYFATPRRKFIIADTPGHVQYTRNMVTGASTADAALILLDARAGVVEQTRRHAAIAALLNLPHVILCINKMDLVEWDESVYEKHRESFAQLALQLGIHNVRTVPISALNGDNVVATSGSAPWYTGPSLLSLLENLPADRRQPDAPARFPVQYVLRPQSAAFPDYRGYAGRVAGGTFRVGDRVTILPAGLSSVIAGINRGEETLDAATDGDSIALTLADDQDISRGDLIVRTDQNLPRVDNTLLVRLCWMGENPLRAGGTYTLRHTTRDARCRIVRVEQHLDIETLQRVQDDRPITKNDIAEVTVSVSQRIAFDAYTDNRITGSVLLIDEATNETVAAGMLQ